MGKVRRLDEAKLKLLIIGAKGFIGAHLARTASDRFDVILGDVAACQPDSEVAIDITDARSVRETFERVRPDVVVLLAAISDIDACEEQKDRAEEVNVLGAVRVAQECASGGARLIYTSSAAVYDGSRHGYSEDEEPNPVSTYGRTKARAEVEILRILPAAIILRPALVLGFGDGHQTNAFLNKLEASLRAGRPVMVPDFEFRNPIDAATLCECMLKLAAAPDAHGIFHVGATESVSRFELVRRLAERMGYASALVVAQTAPVPGRAPRGIDHYLLTGKIHTITGIEMPNCDQVIERCLNGNS